MKFTAKSNQKDLLGAGEHKVTIKSVAETLAKANDSYKDRTPQIEVAYETEKGFLRQWLNLKGYKKDANGNYIVDAKTGNRIEDEENTNDAIAIFARLGLHAGIPEGSEFEPKDLVGMELTIMVEPNEQGKMRVAYTKAPAATVAE
jgi:hypothetical protein